MRSKGKKKLVNISVNFTVVFFVLGNGQKQMITRLVMYNINKIGGLAWGFWGSG
jgi:hypothetical protein